MPSPQFAYGEPVVVVRGAERGRVGVYEDDFSRSGRRIAIVKFGSPFITHEEYDVPVLNLGRPDTVILLKRLEYILSRIHAFTDPLPAEEHIAALQEYYLVEAILYGRYTVTKLVKQTDGASIFLSHSSKDKWFVNRLAVDLTHLGHRVWLDEWEIHIGESIPSKISAGLEMADFIAVVLTEHAVVSKWVESEWQAKYWDEIQQNRTKVLPLLVENCKIPTLLRTRKYADFRTEYSPALSSIAEALKSLHRPKRDA